MTVVTKALALVASIAFFALPSRVRAAGYEASPLTTPRRYDPDSSVAVEIRFGPYRPDVDSEFTNGRAPYREVFGDRRRYMIGGEVDWQAIHVPHFGSLAIGGLIGYTRASGNAALKLTPDQPSGEDTTLSMWSFAALAVLRLDVLARDTWIPIVPYGKLGVGTALWSASNGSGTSIGSDGRAAKGHTNGLVYAIGGAFLLDALDRQAAKTFSVERGVHHTYFFFEHTVASYHGLGQTNAMRLGDKTWTLGISVEI